MQLFMTELCLSVFRDGSSMLLYYQYFVIYDFISPEHTTVGHSADVSLKLPKKFVG